MGKGKVKQEHSEMRTLSESQQQIKNDLKQFGLSLFEYTLAIEYIKDFNVVQAYKRAIRALGMEEKAKPGSMATYGGKILRSPNVREYIEFLFAERGMSATETLAHVSEMARFNPEGAFAVERDNNGEVVSASFSLVEAAKNGLLKYIRSYSEKQEGRITVNFVDRERLYEMLMKAHGFYTDGSPIDRINNKEGELTPMQAIAAKYEAAVKAKGG